MIIMDIEAVLKKLRYKQNYRSIAVNIPSELKDFNRYLSTEESIEPDFTLLFIQSQAEFEARASDVLELVKDL
jgi:hypothetical protein